MIEKLKRLFGIFELPDNTQTIFIPQIYPSSDSRVLVVKKGRGRPKGSKNKKSATLKGAKGSKKTKKRVSRKNNKKV